MHWPLTALPPSPSPPQQQAWHGLFQRQPPPQLWPEAAQAGLAAFLARPEAPNFQLIADQIASRHDFTRHRSSVVATFVPSDTPLAPFEHFRAVFLRMGLPMAEAVHPELHRQRRRH